MLAFGVNLIAKYLMSGRADSQVKHASAVKTRAMEAPGKKEPAPAAVKNEKKAKSAGGSFSFFARPVYFMIKDNFYIVYSSGKKELVNTNIDTASLPIITGVRLEEDRQTHIRVFKEALAIKPSNMKDIAEVSLADPDNIILLTVDGAKIYLGSSIDNDMMENLQLALSHRESKYRSADLRFSDRVIIK